MTANVLDRAIAYLSPRAALKRAHARTVLARMPGYDAAKQGRNRPVIRDGLSPDQLVERSATHLRAQARDLERNHDIARGILRTMVNNIVGANGIGIEPQPRRADGTIHDEYAAALRKAYTDWARKPEVTKRHTWTKVQRLMCKTWLRDGEAFAQELIGPVQLYAHGSRIPFSLEMIEPDLCPFEYTDGAAIVNGIERNTWGEHRRFWFWKTFPGDIRGAIFSRSDMKSVPADLVHHIALLDRIGQTRGVTEFASIITRLADIKNYEESERIAAQIAAALTAYVKRETPDGYDGPLLDPVTNQPIPRSLSLAPGTVIDDLAPGEDIGMINSNRPNPNLFTFRQGQLRAAAAGFGVSYSSIARDYSGTFSSQRQELVEQWVNYATLTDEFVGMFVQPAWESFVRACSLSGQVPVPADVTPGTEDDCLFVAQQMPWIDPLKEANAWLTLVRAGFASEVEVIRKRNGNPRDVLEQIRSFRKDSAGMVFTSDGANSLQGGAANGQEEQPSDPEASAVNQTLMMSLAEIKANMSVRNAPQQSAPTINIAPSPVNVTSHAEADMAPVLDIVRQSLGGMMDGVTQSLAQAIKAGVQSVPAPTILVRAAEQQAPIVNITNDVVVQPAAVEATLSMPDRQTTTDLTYNAAGDIVRTVATEKTV
jgi:lambda family phage portal protein